MRFGQVRVELNGRAVVRDGVLNLAVFKAFQSGLSRSIAARTFDGSLDLSVRFSLSMRRLILRFSFIQACLTIPVNK